MLKAKDIYETILIMEEKGILNGRLELTIEELLGFLQYSYDKGYDQGYCEVTNDNYSEGFNDGYDEGVASVKKLREE